MIAAVRAQLDDATFQATWAQGHELTLEQAMAQALDEGPRFLINTHLGS